MRTVCLIPAVATLALAGAGGQRQIAPPPPQLPVFRSAIELVRLDVSVFDRDRQPIRGLTAADFTIFENGARQELVVFDPVEMKDEVRREAVWIDEVVPDVATNEPAGGRLWVLVLDDATANPEDMWAVNAIPRIARSIVEKLETADRMAVVYTLEDFDARDFTNSRARLLAGIDDFNVGFYGMGRFKNPAFGAATRAAAMGDGFFSSGSAKTLRKVIDHVKTAQEQRRLLVYVGFGNSSPFAKAILEEAEQSGVLVYAFNSCGLQPVTGCGIGRLPQVMAARTSGQRVVPSNDFEPAIEQMFVENKSYYLIGYRTSTPPATSYRRIEVRVDRPDAEVRTRTGYYVESERERIRAAEANARLRPPLAAVTGVMPKSDLPLKLSAAAFAERGRQESTVVLVLGADLGGLVVPATGRAVETLDVEVRAFTPEGLARGQWRQRTSVNIRGASRRATPLAEVMTAIRLRPGRYNVRVGAQAETLGIAGSVYAEVEVPDFAQAPLSLSGLVIGTEPRPASGGESAVTGILPFVPTAQRTLTPRHAATAFVRIHQGGAAPLQPVAVMRRLVDAAGETVSEETEAFDPSRFGRDRAADAAWQVPTPTLKPGLYFLRVAAAMGDTTVTRDVIFRVE